MKEVRADRGPDGRLKAWVCEAWDRVRLRKCADIVQSTFNGEARDRVGGADLVFWDFMVANVLITVVLGKSKDIAIGGDSDRTSWVTANCTVVQIGGSTSRGLYDCAAAK